VLTDAYTVLANVYLSDAAGRPMTGIKVFFVPVGVGTGQDVNLNDYTVLPGQRPIIALTNEFGIAHQDLIIGMTMKVFFEGSSYQRELVVPDSDFNLMAALSTKPDPFTIVQVPPRPIRVTP
jgi:hypothetical protein